MQDASLGLPPSATRFAINFFALLCSLITLVVGVYFKESLTTEEIAGMVLSVLIITLASLESGYFKKNFTTHVRLFPLRFRLRGMAHLRVMTKLLGFTAVLALVALGYWLFPEYHKSFYQPFYNLLWGVSPHILIAIVLYFYYVDQRMQDPQDGYYVLGRMLLGQWHGCDKKVVAQLLLGWLVKAFFLPLMLGFWLNDIQFIIQFDFSQLFNSFNNFYEFSYRFIFYVDVLFAVTGYLCTLKLFDSHIRSTESSCLGWVVAILCYPPFWDYIGQNYLAYDAGTSWGYWFWGHEFWAAVWGSVILLLSIIYSLSTVCFGLRFSNLTHRGILTNGPYRYLKHPAYVSKCLSWWMISMPFMSKEGVSGAIQHSLLLLLLSGIYFLRARTEERHLSWDPTYVAYAEYMNEHSIFAWLGRLFPILKFKPQRLFNVE